MADDGAFGVQNRLVDTAGWFERGSTCRLQHDLSSAISACRMLRSRTRGAMHRANAIRCALTASEYARIPSADERGQDTSLLCSRAMMKRMNRKQFFDRLATLDEERLRKALWSLYWRGTELIRERIEAEIDPDQAAGKKAAPVQPVDPELVLEDVRDFVALARSGSYMGGDRRVSPRERSGWRFTFQRLAADAQACLMTEDLCTASAAMEELIDFACELRGYEYFHTEDALEAARFVVSDVAAMLWRRIYEHDGFPAFASMTASQLIRWESAYGWTRGFGRVAEAETCLASVIAGMLRNHAAWIAFADRYLDALDEAAGGDEPDREHSFRPPNRVREDRARNLSTWHMLMLDRLFDPETEDRLDRLVTHPALGGPELAFVHARLAQRRGDLGLARRLVSASLEKLPGHRAFLDFAIEIDVPLPALAR